MAARSVEPKTLPTQPETLANKENGEFSPNVLAMLREAIASGQRAKGQHVVGLVGPTGAGKSTIVNSLHDDVQMVGRRVGGQYRIEVEGGREREKAAMGHHRLTSETLFPQVYHPEGLPPIIDFGGVLDTRGPEAEVAIAVAMKLILENAASVRLLVCYDSNGMAINRGGDLCDILDRIYRKFLREGYKNELRSIALLLTKVNRSETGWNYTEDADTDGLRYLEECRDETLPDGDQRALFDFVVREGGRYLKTFKPLERASKVALKALIADMEGIQNPKGKFRLTYSAEAAIAIMRGFTQIALSGREFLDEHQSIIDESKRQNDELMALDQQINHLKDAVQRLAPGMNPSPEEIEQVKKQLIEECKQIEVAEERAIEQLNGEISEIEAAINAVQDRLDLWNREGEQEVEYWSQSINQKGVPDQKGTSVTVKTRKSGFLGIGGGSTEKTTTTPDIPGRSIGHDFEYRGPKYLRIVRDSPQGNWSNEIASENKTSYKIHFESGVGMDAVATVRAIIAKANDPEHQHKLIQLTSEETQLERQKNERLAQIAVHQEQVNRAQSIISATQNIVDQLQAIGNELDKIENSKGELNDKIAQTNLKLRSIEEGIEAKKTDFQFLFDYLELSGDEHVGNEPLIVQFLQKYKLYGG